MKNTNNGFSLVEVMVTAAILGAMAVVGMQITQTQTKSNIKASFDSETLLITNEIVALLSDPNVCLLTLGGKNAISTITGINSINGKYYSIASGSSPVNGYGNIGLKINNYGLTSTVSEIANNNAYFEIAFLNKSFLKSSSGPSVKSKKINLFVQVDGSNNITKCRSLSSSTADIWTRGSGSEIYYSGGPVGIGTNNPITALDVAGEIRAGSAGVTLGAACSNEGAFAYDLGNHIPVYCNNDSPIKHWAAMGGGGGSSIGLVTGGCTWGSGWGTATSCSNTITCQAGNTARVIIYAAPSGIAQWNSSGTYAHGFCIKN